MSWFMYNGISSESKHLKIATAPARSVAARELDAVNLSNLNGEFFGPNVRYKNITRSYSISLYNPSLTSSGSTKVELLANDLIMWLHPNDTRYHELRDSFDQEHTRMAICSNAMEVQSMLNEAAVATVQFNCKPQLYRNTGLVLTSFGSSSRNGGIGKAWPLIVATRTSSAGQYISFNVVYGNGRAQTISIPASSVPYPLTLYIDTETGEVYDQNGKYTYTYNGVEHTYCSLMYSGSTIHNMGIDPGNTIYTSVTSASGFSVGYKVRSWIL